MAAWLVTSPASSCRRSIALRSVTTTGGVLGSLGGLAWRVRSPGGAIDEARKPKNTLRSRRRLCNMMGGTRIKHSIRGYPPAKRRGLHSVAPTAIELVLSTMNSKKSRDAAPRPRLGLRLGHSNSVMSVGFSHDGELIASSSAEGTVKLWDVASGELLRTIVVRDPQDDGEEVWLDTIWVEHGTVTFLKDDAVPLVEVESRTVWRFRLRGKDRTLALDMRGWIVSLDGTLRAWRMPFRLADACTGDELWTLEHDERTRGIAKRRAGLSGEAISPSEDIWWAAHVGPVAFSSDSGTIAFMRQRALELRDARTGSIKSVVHMPDDMLGEETAIAVAHDGSTAAAAGSLSNGVHSFLLQWDVETGELTHSTLVAFSEMEQLAFSPDGGMIVAGTRGGLLLRWQPRKDDTVLETRMPGSDKWIRDLAFSSDGASLGVACDDFTVRLYDASTFMLKHTLGTVNRELYAVDVSPDGGTIATVGADTMIRLWDAATGAPKRTFPGLVSSSANMSYSRDGSRLLLCSHLIPLRLLDARNGNILREFLTGDGVPMSSAMSSDGSLLAVAAQWNAYSESAITA